MRKAFVQSVGTGTRPDQDITRPLLWHWKKSHPDFTTWVVSDESRPHAERMARELALSTEAFRIHAVHNTDDVEAVYRDCAALLRDLDHQGFLPDAIDVDYTSGTKAMTAGLVLAAVAHRCGTLSYISGVRQSGVVVGGSERVVAIEPRRIWADERMKLARDYCRALRFEAALALLDSINPVWLGDDERQLATCLRTIANGYGAWDRFDYGRATGELTKLMEVRDERLAWLREFRPAQPVLNVLPNLKPERGCSADRLADLFNNAGRRLDEGRYDDALARLYRAAEMLAQWVLQERYGIETAQVDLSKVPSALRETLASLRNRQGLVQIGLDWDYQLLKALGHPLGERFDQGSFHGIGVLLKKRNTSLLAHGLEPIQKSDVESLREKLATFIATEVPDFLHRCAALEFPWRRSRG